MTTLTPGEAYTAAEAARVLGLSPKRVRQLAEEGRLDVVEAGPLRVSAVSVLRVRDERSAAAAEALQSVGGGQGAQGGKPGSPPPPSPSTDLVPILVAMQDRAEAAAQREKAEAVARGVAEAQARHLEDELHRVRAEAQGEREELQRARAELAVFRDRERGREGWESPLPLPSEGKGAPREPSLSPAVPVEALAPAPDPALTPRAGLLARLFGRH